MAKRKNLREKLLKQQHKLELKEKELEFRKTYITTITGALTFVAGLFWRDVINSYLELLPQSQGLVGITLSAIIITGIFVMIIIHLNTEAKKVEQKIEKEKKKLEEKN